MKPMRRAGAITACYYRAYSSALRVALPSLILICCGPTPPGETEGTSEDEAASRLALTICDAIRSCGCARPPAPWDSCEDELTRSIEEWQSDAIRSGLSFDSECLQRHISDRKASPCAPMERCLIYSGDGGKADMCASFDPAGFFSTCQQGYECPRFLGYCVERDSFEEAGPLAEGDQCLDEASNVVGVCGFSEDLYCNFEAPVPTCEPRSPSGALCEMDNACVAGSHCNSSKCVSDKMTGDFCARREECASFACINGKCVEPLAVPSGCDYLLP